MASKLSLDLNSRSSYFAIFRALEFNSTASQVFLDSPTFHIVNPRNHITKGDTVSVKLSPSVVSGLQDEAVLALLTKGFFGGWVFALEGWAMRTFHPLLPAIFAALPDLPTKNIVWRSKDISKDKLAPIGDMFFDFAVVNKHIQAPSDPLPSYVDYGFGSDHRVFSGSQRFSVTRHEPTPDAEEDRKTGLLQSEMEDGYVELTIECFVCNPLGNRACWAEYLPWLHYWYAKCLWAEAVRRVLRR